MKTRWKILGGIIPAVFAADQAVKHLIVRTLPQGASVPVIPGIFDIVHTRNRGAAFGFMADLPESVRIPFFLIVSAAALAAITFYFFRMREGGKSQMIALALILGGALGNIWDRIRLGEVIDFLSFHWYDAFADWRWGGWRLRFKLEWPAFNIADAAISVAVAWLMIAMLLERKPDRTGS